MYKCYICKSIESPQWRKDNKEHILCNACGLRKLKNYYRACKFCYKIIKDFEGQNFCSYECKKKFIKLEEEAIDTLINLKNYI